MVTSAGLRVALPASKYLGVVRFLPVQNESESEDNVDDLVMLQRWVLAFTHAIRSERIFSPL